MRYKMQMLISQMNRAMEMKVAFKDAYYVIMGDYAEAVMVQKIANHENASQQLRARAWRWLADNAEIVGDKVGELSWYKVEV